VQAESTTIKNVDLDETVIAITADYTTSSTTREHEGDPVPIAIQGPNVRSNNKANPSHIRIFE